MRYFFYSRGRIGGPYSDKELLSVEGFGPDSFVCPEGAPGTEPSDWRRAETHLELSALFPRQATLASAGTVGGAGGWASLPASPEDYLSEGPPPSRPTDVLGLLDDFWKDQAPSRMTLAEEGDGKLAELENRLVDLTGKIEGYDLDQKALLQRLEEKDRLLGDMLSRIEPLERELRSAQAEKEAALRKFEEEMLRLRQELAVKDVLIDRLKGKGGLPPEIRAPQLDVSDLVAELEEALELPAELRAQPPAPPPEAATGPLAPVPESPRPAPEAPAPTGPAPEPIGEIRPREIEEGVEAPPQASAQPLIEVGELTAWFKSPELAETIEPSPVSRRTRRIAAVPTAQAGEVPGPSAPEAPGPAAPAPEGAPPALQAPPPFSEAPLAAPGPPGPESLAAPLAAQTPSSEARKPTLAEAAASLSAPSGPVASQPAPLPEDLIAKLRKPVEAPSAESATAGPAVLGEAAPPASRAGLFGRLAGLLPGRSSAQAAAGKAPSRGSPGLLIMFVMLGVVISLAVMIYRNSLKEIKPVEPAMPEAPPELGKQAPAAEQAQAVPGAVQGAEQETLATAAPAADAGQAAPVQVTPGAKGAGAQDSAAEPGAQAPPPEAKAPVAPAGEAGPERPSLARSVEALQFVKNYLLDGGRGSVSRWFQQSFLASPGHQEDWRSTPIDGDDFLVEYRVLAPSASGAQPIIGYQFRVDLAKRSLSGHNGEAQRLLSGGPGDRLRRSPRAARRGLARKPKGPSGEEPAPRALPLLPLPSEEEGLP